jgi:aromatic-L-amino-acid decarboxylase
MPPEEFRNHAHRLVDWVADYLAHSEKYPVLAQVRPGHIRSALPAEPPATGEPFSAILADVDGVLMPGMTHWNSPNFFAYFAISASAPGVMADFLASALNQQAMLWRTSPTATELEEVVMGWLRQMLRLPSEFEGVVYDTASISSLHALAAAREAALPSVREQGLSGRPEVPRLRVYCSDQAHSSIDKAVILLGLGHSALRKIPTDADFRLRPDALAAAIAEDRASGWRPLAVVATVGTTSTTSVDPVPAIAEICEREDLWLHVDAAYGGAAALVEGFEWVLAGCERADSLVMNPHKWLFTPFDFSAFFCRRMDIVRAAFSLVPEYLRTADPSGIRNLMDTGVQLGRRFRALKLWMIIRYFGVEGLRARIAEHMRLARLFAAWVDADPGFERLAPTPMSVVCFRARPADGPWSEGDLEALNSRLLERVNATGETFLSHTKLGGRFTLRLAVGHIRTTEAHVRHAWDLLRRHAEELSSPTAMG